MKKNDWKKWAVYSAIGLAAVCFLFWVVIPAVEIIGINVLNFLLDYIQEHLFGVFIVTCIVGMIVACVCQKPNGEPTGLVSDPKPTMNDYETIVRTIYMVAKKIGESLGLATVRSYEDLYVDEADRILRWENVWGMKYKMRKMGSTTNFDISRAKEAFQTEIETIMNKYNPSKLAQLHYSYHGKLKSVIQVADMEDGNAYVYIYIVLALTDTYFVQKANDERNDVAEIETNTDDGDF